MNPELSPEQTSGGSDTLNKPTLGHFFLMKLGICHSFCKRSCCVSYKNENFRGSVAQAPSPLTSGVLAATNQDLEDAIRDRYFREDLYHRLAAFPIAVPSLRDRREDIPILAHHFLKKYAAAAENPIRDISTDALQMLVQHDFPGNVRELEDAIERAVLYETTDRLQPQSLLLHQRQERSQPATSSPTDATTILPLDELERRAIVHALKVTDNNTADAARALGIDRSTLYRKLKKYNLLQ